MNPEFEQHVRSCIPDESIYLHFGRKITTGRMEQNTSAMELEDGSLVTVVSAGRSVSTDGGDTWTEPDPVSDGAGNRLDVGFRGLVRLKSGRMGGFEAQSGHGALFRSSDDDGKSWSEPTRVGRRYNIRTGEPNDLAYMHSPGIVTSDGRLVAAVFVMLGHHIPRERGRAFWGDDVVLVGHHGYEQCLCMVWVYHSDDEGKTWQANEGTGIFKSGGELFITLGSRPVKWCKSASSCCCCLGGCRLREIGLRKSFVEGQNGGCEVSTSDDPFVVLLSQDGANEAAHGRPVREDAHHIGASPDLLVETLLWVVGPELLPVGEWEAGEGQDVGSRFVQ